MDHADFLIDGHSKRRLTVIMDGNPLNCDCQIIAFKTFRLKGINFEYSNLTCQQPPGLAKADFASCKTINYYLQILVLFISFDSFV